MGFAAGGVLDEGEEVKAREDRVGEEMGGGETGAGDATKIRGEARPVPETSTRC